MSDPLNVLQLTLRQDHKSLTKPRSRVFQALQTDESLTMAELVARCAGIDRVSIYRTIELFEHLHIVQRLQIGWKYKLELTGSFVAHHHHASCEECGRVIALPEDAFIEERLHLLAAGLGFDLHDHQLELVGVCTACQSSH